MVGPKAFSVQLKEELLEYLLELTEDWDDDNPDMYAPALALFTPKHPPPPCETIADTSSCF
jgi:hypothetical protein